MYQFLETIQLRDGEFNRLNLHQQRMQGAVSAFYPDVSVPSLSKQLSEMDFPADGLFKCRVIYDSEIRKIEFLPYTLPVIRSLRIVETDIDSLPYKMADRSGYQALFAKRGDRDDVLILKNGLLTDTSYCNIALYDGSQWVTPALPLIQGVNRAQLINDRRVITKDLSSDDLLNYKQIRLFNALIEFGEIELNISSVCRDLF